jgi:hypothetical protein
MAKTPFDPKAVYDYKIPYNGKDIQDVLSVSNGTELAIIARPYHLASYSFGIDLYRKRTGSEWIYTQVYNGGFTVTAGVALDVNGQTVVFYKNASETSVHASVTDGNSITSRNFNLNGFSMDASIQAVKAIGVSDCLFSVNYWNGTKSRMEIDVFRFNSGTGDFFSAHAGQPDRLEGNEVLDTGICPSGDIYALYCNLTNSMIFYEIVHGSSRSTYPICSTAGLGSGKAVFTNGNALPNIILNDGGLVRIFSPDSTAWSSTIPSVNIGDYKSSPCIVGSNGFLYVFTMPTIYGGPEFGKFKLTQYALTTDAELFGQDLYFNEPYDTDSDLSFEVYACRIDSGFEGLMSVSWRSGPDSGIRIHAYQSLDQKTSG